MSTNSPLREKNFRWFCLSELVNLSGSYMNSVALGFAVLSVSDSPSALGVVLAAHSVPMVIVLLGGGVIADRFGRTLVIQASNAGAGLTQLAIAVLLISGTATIGWLVVLTAVNGVFAAAGYPAAASLLPELVPADQLQPANALMSLLRNGLHVIAPSVAGVLVVTAGAGWALGFDGATYLVSAALLLRVRIPSRIPEAGTSMLGETREGWAYVRTTAWLAIVIASFTVLNGLMSGAQMTLGPVLALRTSIGESGWGIILSAEAAGLLATAAVLLRVRLERPLFWGMAAIALVGVDITVLGSAPYLPILLVTAFLGGAGTEVFGMGWSLAMQEHVPSSMLPRAYSYDALGSCLAVPIGQLAAGPLGAAFGLRPTIVVAGILFIVVCFATLGAPSVRGLDRTGDASLASG